MEGLPDDTRESQSVPSDGQESTSPKGKSQQSIQMDVLTMFSETMFSEFKAELDAAREFAAELDAAPSHHEEFSAEREKAHDNSAKLAPFSDSEWLSHLELQFSLRAQRMKIVRSLGFCLVGQNGWWPSKISIENKSVRCSCSKLTQLSPRKEALAVANELLKAIDAYATARLEGTNPDIHPLVLRLVRRYRLSTGESQLFQLLFVRGASKSTAVRTHLGVHNDEKETIMELCGMNLLEVEDFLDDKRTHMAEGVILVEEKGLSYGKTLRMNRDAISVLLLKPLKTEQRLKFSRTELLNVMDSSMGGSRHSISKEPGSQALSSRSDMAKPLANLSQQDAVANEEPVEGQKPELKNEPDSNSREPGAQTGEVDELRQPGRESARKEDDTSRDAGNVESDSLTELKSTSEADVNHPMIRLELGLQRGATPMDNMDNAELCPYSSSLEYLDDCFQELALMIRMAKARQKDEIKEALNHERAWFDRSSKVASVRELEAKLRFVRNRLQERMHLTEKASSQIELPRLEALARKLGLDEFEKGVVVMLAGIAISPVLKTIHETDANRKYRPSGEFIQVKDILVVFFTTFKEQVLARTYFYKSSRLAARGLIKLRASPFSRMGGGDLMDQQVELDRRMLDWIVGLDTEMNELVEGSHLYKPKISMEQVVLPEEQKDTLLTTVENFGKLREFRKTSGLEDVMSYGAGLVVLLCGPSGTGKTMTVNAVAHHLGKRVLLVDFHSLYKTIGSATRDDQSMDIRGLFRDADMNDAIIFFDECEAIFIKRDRGGDKLLNSLLTEIERYEGIVMLATNRPLDLDEAMHRRITCVSEFYPPDHIQRRAIWTLASERLPVTMGIDWNMISLRYELTGGYIKNALVGALLAAISRDNLNPELTEDDIVAGCRLQMRGSLQMKTFAHRVVPKTGLDELILSTGMRGKMDAIISFQKARGVLLGQWGFQAERIGTACLFWGPRGTGKSAACEAIGFELGRPLKVVNCAQLVSREGSSKIGNNIRMAFRDAQLMDAVLVLDDFQLLWRDAVAGVGSVSQWSDAAIGLLLHELGCFPGICILIANNVQGSIVHRIDPELTRRLKFLVEFKMPDGALRSRMWRKMIPEKCPIAPDVKFEDLGRRFDFASEAISSAIVRGAAKASLRPEKENILTFNDLVEAAEAERAHYRDEISELLLSAYV